MIERIKQFIESQNISVRAFEMQIGASNGLIRKAIANNTDIQSKWISSIAENYPQISLAWLITGKGEMLKKDESSIEKTDASTSDLAERYLKMLEANARTIESQQQIIADMTKKLGNDAPRRVAKVGE